MKICVFGDSITWGAFDLESGGWVERLKVHFFNNNTETYIYNCGVSGDKVNDLLKRFDTEAVSRKPDKIIFSIGINDSANKDNPGGTPIDEFKSSYKTLLDKAEKLTKDILVVGLNNIDEASNKFGYRNEEIKKYNDVINEISQERNLKFADCFGILTKEDFYTDGDHPNSSGHQKIFEKVLHILK